MQTEMWTAASAVTLYLAATVVVGLQLRGALQPRRGLVLILGGLAVLFHACCLAHVVITDSGIQLGLFPVASLVGMTGVALVVVSSLYRPLEWISVMIFPLAAATIPAALWIRAAGGPPPLEHGIGTHVLLSILATAVFGIAAAHSILLLVQHRQLKEGHIRGVMRLFPPIQVMETMLFEMLWLGLILLTAAIITGFVYVQDLFAQHLVHKTVLTLAAWLLFATLLTGRHFLGWRAMTAVRYTLGGFIVLVLAFFGSQLVLEFILHRT